MARGLQAERGLFVCSVAMLLSLWTTPGPALSTSDARGDAGRPSPGPPAGVRADQPALSSVEPLIVGVGTKLRIRGTGLGAADTAAVAFAGGVVSNWVEKHTPTEIVVRVPIGAECGPVRVVVGAGGAPQLAALETSARQAALARARSVASPQALMIVPSFVRAPARSQVVGTGHGLEVLRNRIIIDLADFRGFDDAARITQQLNGTLVGFFAPSNSYVIDLAEPRADYAGLQAALALAASDPAVVEVSPDLVLATKQVTFADTDDVARYQQMRTPPSGNINGREDVWHFDRCQAPAAWNLMARFVPTPAAVKVAVLDTGCDQTHAEFAGVTLTQIKYAATNAIEMTLTGGPGIFPGAIVEEPYTRGDGGSGHGTSVCSIIGAANGAVIPGAPNGDRGLNGLLAGGGGAYTLQIHRGGAFPVEPGEGDTYTLTDFLEAINGAALTTPAGRVTVINASWGQPRPIDPITHPDANIVRVALRKLALQLNVFSAQVLLCVAAGNEGRDPASYNGGEVTPFEDFNLNGVLDAGEDVDGDGGLDHGNYVAASLGTLPNVISVGAIIGSLTTPPGLFTRDDELWDDGFGGSASNWGTRFAGATLDVVIGLGAPGGREIFAASVSTNPLAFQIGTQWYRAGTGGFGGTSAATPHVTGSAGLLLAIDPTLTPAQVKTRLLDSSFPIDTKTTTGLDLHWSTLKVGAAVRKLLLDKGTITDDQEWTGTSKMLGVEFDPTGTFLILKAHEIRQNPATRRSELFGPTTIATLALPPPPPPGAPAASYAAAFSWSGVKVAFDDLDIMEYNIQTAATRFVLAGPAIGSMMLHYAGEDHVISSRQGWDPGCEVPWDGYECYDDGALYTVGTPPFPPGTKFWWFASHVPKPDNKSVYFSYAVEGHEIFDPPCGSIGITLGVFAATRAYPAGGGPWVLGLFPDDTPWYLPLWSPDGRLFTGTDGTGLLQAVRFGPNGAALWADPLGPKQVWSPDGSEIVVGDKLYKRNHTAPIVPFVPSPSWSW